MSEKIRKLIKKRRSVFRKEGRSLSWKRIKAVTNKMIEERRTRFNVHTRDKFLSRTDSKSFHKGVKTFLNAEEASKWDVRALFPGQPDKEVAENLAGYFNNISQEYQPLDMTSLPRTYDRPFPRLGVEEVAGRLKRARKTTFSRACTSYSRIS